MSEYTSDKIPWWGPTVFFPFCQANPWGIWSVPARYASTPWVRSLEALDIDIDDIRRWFSKGGWWRRWGNPWFGCAAMVDEIGIKTWGGVGRATTPQFWRANGCWTRESNMLKPWWQFLSGCKLGRIWRFESIWEICDLYLMWVYILHRRVYIEVTY